MTKIETFAILLKTYYGDIQYVNRLIKSYHKHNKDHITLHIVVPSSDIKYFKKYSAPKVFIHTDESISNQLVSDNSVRGIRPGYINQEIIKLSFWRKKLCKNYFCMDSDGVFIKDFFIHDFMYDKQTPYTILVEDNELRVDSEYYKTYWQGREKLIRAIAKSINLKSNVIITCHSFPIFSGKVLRSMYKKYLQPNNLSYADILRIAPYECSWYNLWLQKDLTIPIHLREPLIKMFHQKSHHIDYITRGITLKDIARGYLGYNINSNYSRGYGVLNYYEYKKYSPSPFLINLEKLPNKFVLAIKRLLSI